MLLTNNNTSTHIDKVIQRAGQLNEAVPLTWFHVVGSCVFFRCLKEQKYL